MPRRLAYTDHPDLEPSGARSNNMLEHTHGQLPNSTPTTWPRHLRANLRDSLRLGDNQQIHAGHPAKRFRGYQTYSRVYLTHELAPNNAIVTGISICHTKGLLHVGLNVTNQQGETSKRLAGTRAGWQAAPRPTPE